VIQRPRSILNRQDGNGPSVKTAASRKKIEWQRSSSDRSSAPERVTSRAGFLLNEAEQLFLTQHFFLLVLRVRKSIVNNTSRMSPLTNFSIFPVRSGKISWIMPSVDELPCAVRTQQKEKQRDELERKRFFAEELIYAVQDFLWPCSRLKELGSRRDADHAQSCDRVWLVPGADFSRRRCPHRPRSSSE
jgi:hypothetical protein